MPLDTRSLKTAEIVCKGDIPKPALAGWAGDRRTGPLEIEALVDIAVSPGPNVLAQVGKSNRSEQSQNYPAALLKLKVLLVAAFPHFPGAGVKP